MNHFSLRLPGAAALVLALGAAPAVFGESASERFASPSPILESLTTAGVRLGFGVTPLRPPLGPPVALPGAHGGESQLALRADSRGTAVSFDLELAWPGAARLGPLEPYLAVGPALLVVEPDWAGRFPGTPVLQLGARAGAGVTWRVGKRTTLFGTYGVTTTGPGALSAGGGNVGHPGIGGYDFTYGLRVLY